MVTKYNATKAREAWGDDKCLPHLFCKGLHLCDDPCPKPGDPAHQLGGAAHTLPDDAATRKSMNMRSSESKGKGGKGKGK